MNFIASPFLSGEKSEDSRSLDIVEQQLKALKTKANGLLDTENWQRINISRNILYYNKRVRLLSFLLSCISDGRVSEQEFLLYTDKENWDISVFLSEKNFWEVQKHDW